MDEIHVHKTKKSICAHFAESPCIRKIKFFSIIIIFYFFSNPCLGRLTGCYTLPKGNLEKVVTGFPYSSQLIEDKLTTGCSYSHTQEKVL